ncbi:Histidyl-tRNA synthetase [Giardia muris]|uniref:histidine--tRNA ligase n=1 Tax=Giardia muris TaxID=5742 RepID=A0A4Z1TAK8_GIAMU|nr:Histidyl-tRNA synthetase [Giardia muris]|eukprot:TNJ30257.1 Histidyl-tRNA synthetase [Giardia muris]
MTLEYLELGGTHLSLETLYRVAFCSVGVRLDSTVATLFPAVLQESDSTSSISYSPYFQHEYTPLFEGFARGYAATLLSMLLNSPGCVHLSTIEYLVQLIEPGRSLTLKRPVSVLAPNKELEKDLLDQLFAGYSLPIKDRDVLYLNGHALTLTLTNLSSILLTLLSTSYEVLLSLSYELFCVQAKDLLEMTNFTVRRRVPSLKACAEHVTAMVTGSKKVGSKRTTPYVMQTLNLASALRDVAISLRTTTRLDVTAACYASQDSRPTMDFVPLHILTTIPGLTTALTASMKKVRKEIEQLTVEKGIWKALPDEVLADIGVTIEKKLMDCVTAPHLITLPSEICEAARAVHGGLLAAKERFLLIKSQLTKGKPQIGQGSLLFVEEYIETVDSSLFLTIFNLHQAATNVLFAAVSTTRVPQPPCGMRDLLPTQMVVRQKALDTVTSIFRKHGAVCIETPVMESRTVLLGKYGEDQKLVYDIADFGEDLLSLRYDLTVPFARYCATHRIKSIKRYSIGRVYRRDKPVMEKGRFREFYQCDFDIAQEPGVGVPNVADAEVLAIIHDILDSLKVGQFIILVNHRALIDCAMTVAGVPSASFRAVCTCIDALDKLNPDEVKQKLINERGLSEECADTLLTIACFNYEFTSASPKDVASQFAELNAQLAAKFPLFHERAHETLMYLQQVFQYLGYMAPTVLDTVRFDMSLARGLDYYTGIIFEAKLVVNGEYSSSISGGGRYDKLLGTFRSEGQELHAVGGSIGIERLFALLEEQRTATTGPSPHSYDVYVCTAPGGTLASKLEVVGLLWAAGLNVGFTHKEGGSQKTIKRDFEEAVEGNALLAIILGGEEVEMGLATVKNLKTQQQTQVAITDLLEHVKKALAGRNARLSLQLCQAALTSARGGEPEMVEEALDAVRNFLDV